MAVVPARPSLHLPAVRAGRRAGIGIDALLVAALLALAGAVRWPHLLLSPQFPSIGETALLALDVADGRAFHLADSAPYLGAPFLYILAAVYALAGPSVQATLLVAWAVGTLTVVPTYLLGREAGGGGALGRVAGLVAGALLATSSAHTVISSHVPLSHSLTPLVATTTLWLLARAVRRAGERRGAWSDGHRADAPVAARGGRLLALAGLGAGLSLQTHPTVLPLLAGAALGAVAMRPFWLRSRWLVAALALVVVGYGGLLAHHVASRFEVVEDVRGKQARYLDADQDADESAERGVYLNNLEQLGLSLVRLTSGTILDRDDPSEYLADGWVLAYAALAAGGLIVGARRGAGWLVPGVALMVLLPPLLSGKYRPILDGRYLMPLVPVLFVGVGLLFAEAARLAGRLGAPDPPADDRGIPRRGPAVAARLGQGAVLVALAGLALALAARPVALLGEFYEETEEDGFSNALYLRTLDEVLAARVGGEGVILDERLVGVKSPGGGNAGTNFRWLLAVSRVPTEALAGPDGASGARTPDARVIDPRALDGRLAILHRSTAEALEGRLSLAPLDGRRLTGRDRPSYRAYRVAVRAEAATASGGGDRAPDAAGGNGRASRAR